ncbi:MAG TPA: phytanoyl-CoA dioxygenase family protein [Gammaproteobacteria bacterium]|nr:phytanoyl-CoA dioxygenase family protein [Gammaproteobacteria bacterium]
MRARSDIHRTRRSCGLSDAEVHDFFEVGWITRRALFDPREVERMRACFDRLEQLATELPETGLYRGSRFVLDEQDARRVIKRVVWAGGCQPDLLEIGDDPRLTVPCAQLLGSDAMDHLLSQAHFKRPHDGVVFDWHQDIQHRDKGGGTWTDVNGTGSFVQTLILLDEMTPDSGPILFMPGSSTWGRVDFGPHDYNSRASTTARPAQFRAERAVTIAARPGDTLFFGPYTAHASFENTSNHYRRVLINGYASPGANRRIYPGCGLGRRLSAP